MRKVGLADVDSGRRIVRGAGGSGRAPGTVRGLDHDPRSGEIHDLPRLWPIPRGRVELWLLLILLGGLAARAAFLTAHLVLLDDELHYAEALSHFMRGEIIAGVSDYWSFFYPFAALPFALITGDAERGLRLLSVLSSAACVIPAFLIARAMWGLRAALFAAALVAFHPNLVSSSAAAMTEPLFTLLLLLSTYFFIQGLGERRGRNRSIAALLLGLAYLTRPEGEFVLLLFVVILLLAGGGSGVKRRGSIRIRQAGGMLALFLLVLAPYVILVHAKTGHWSLGSKASVNVISPYMVAADEELAKEKLIYSLGPDGTRRLVEEAGEESALEIAWREKGRVTARFAANLIKSPDIIPTLVSVPALMLIIPLGLFGRRWARERKGAEWTLALLGVFPFVVYSAILILHRYFFNFLPIYLLWAGIGCERFLAWFDENVSQKRGVATALVLLLFVSFLPYTVHKYRNLERSQPIESKEIGRWIRENGGMGSRILAKPGCSISYYAGVPQATFLPWTDLTGLLRYARSLGFTYLVVHQDYVRDMRPTLRELISGRTVEGLQEVHRFTTRDGEPVVLYRITPAAG